MLIDRYSDGFENVKILVDNDNFEGVGAAINNSLHTFDLGELLKYACNKGKEKFYPVAAHVINAILKEEFLVEEENACLNKDLMNAIYKSDLKKLKDYIRDGSTNAKALSLLYISADDSFQGAEVGNDLTGDDRQIVLGVSFRIALEILDFKRMLNIFPLGVDAGLQGRALILAAWEGHVGFVKALLAYKVDGKVVIDINAKNSKGDTALIVAAREGHLDVFNALLAKDADINAKNSKGDTALIVAAREGHLGVFNALLAKDADINAKNFNGDTALMLAAQWGHIYVVNALLAKGADINAQNFNGDTALILAVFNGGTDVVNALLAKGADINVEASDGNTALILAAREGRVGAVKLLIRHGADPAIKGGRGKAALDVGSDYMKSLIREEWKRAKLYSIAKPVLYSAVTIGCTGGGYALLLYGAPMVLSVASATYAMLGAAAAFGALVSFLLGEAYPEGIKDVACKAYTKLGMTRYDLAISSETDSVGLAA